MQAYQPKRMSSAPTRPERKPGEAGLRGGGSITDEMRGIPDSGFAAARSGDCGTLIPVDTRSISTDIIP
jgi:hypothetical protein